VALGEGVDAVPDPVLGRGGFGGGIEYFLSLDMDGLVVGGEPVDDGDEAFDLISPFFEGVCVCESAGGQDKGIEQDEPQIGVGLAAGVQNEAVVGFPCRDVDAVEISPDIIDADEDAEEIGFHVDGVFLPTVAEVCDFVGTDAAIVDVKPGLGHVDAESGGDKVDVTVAEIMIAVFLVASPFHIGDGVALKEEAATLFEFGQSVVVAADPGGIGTRTPGPGICAEHCSACCCEAALEQSTSM